MPDQNTPSEINNTPQAVSSEACNWALCTHLASLAAFIIPVVGSVIGPWLVWMFKKDVMPFVDRHGREAINFQISMMIYFVISILLCVLLVGFLFIWLIPILDVLFVIIAAIKASNGK